jgi:hypothetical protein
MIRPFEPIRRGLSGPTVADWRRFFDPRFRVFHRIALAQGLLVVAGLEVVIPFAIDIGCPPALTALLGALPVAGGMAQLAVPRLLARTNGNLRGLTVFVTGLADARALLYLLVALALVTGLASSVMALVLLALVIGMAGVASALASANQLAWYAAVLPEEDRRLVMPRMAVVVMAVAVLALFPLGLTLDPLAERFGLIVYVVLFAGAALVSLLDVASVRRLPSPGRVVVPPRAMTADQPESPAERQFLKVSALNALGMGLTPMWAVYAMSVLGLSAGFALTMSAVSQLAMVIAAAIGGGLLMRGSSAALLRWSFGIRAIAVALPIAALPGSFLAPLIMYLSTALAGMGFGVGQLASNERLFRLVHGPTVIRQYGRMLFRTSAAMTGGQVASGLVLAVGGPIGYPAFAALFGASSIIRLVAYRFSGALPSASQVQAQPALALPTTVASPPRPATNAG